MCVIWLLLATVSISFSTLTADLQPGNLEDTVLDTRIAVVEDKLARMSESLETKFNKMNERINELEGEVTDKTDKLVKAQKYIARLENQYIIAQKSTRAMVMRHDEVTQRTLQRLSKMEQDTENLKEVVSNLQTSNLTDDTSSFPPMNDQSTMPTLPASTDPSVAPVVDASITDQILKLFARRSCHEWLTSGFTSSGIYSIDPDGLSIGEQPISVFCNMSTGFTILRHDHEGIQEATSCTGPACYRAKLNYEASETQINALMRTSQSCQQHMEVNCLESPFYSEGTVLSYWIGSDGLQHYEWAGHNYPDHTCACGLLGSCLNRMKSCNCDADIQNRWVSDRGDVTNHSALPVQEVIFGTKNEDTPLQVNYSVGRLQCYGSRSLSYPTSCRDLFRRGSIHSGWYVLGRPESLHFTYCNMESLEVPNPEKELTFNHSEEPVESADVDIGDVLVENLQAKGFIILKKEQLNESLKFTQEQFNELLKITQEQFNETLKIKQEQFNELLKTTQEQFNETLDITQEQFNEFRRTTQEQFSATLKITQEQQHTMTLTNNQVRTLRSDVNTLKTSDANTLRAKVAFHANANKDLSEYEDPLRFNRVEVNQRNGYNQHTGLFVAPISGVYFFAAYGQIESGTTFFYIKKNSFKISQARSAGYQYEIMGSSVIVDMDEGDQVGVYLGRGKLYGNHGKGTAFLGFLIFET